jgi:hypothetical protein
MRYIYVDNFRGFSNTLIPIKDVNFLVGENSTGKSSILSLINLMSIPQFWLYQEFNTEEFRFGGFKDIISAESANKNSFRVGMVDSRKDSKTGKIHFMFFIFTFREDEGQPVLYRYTRLTGSNIGKLIFLRSTPRYKIKKVQKPSSPEAALKLFDEVQKEDKRDRNDFRKIPVKIPLTRRGNFPQAISVLDALAEEKKLDPHTISLEFPIFSFELAWLAPIRTKPKRTYDVTRTSYTPEGDHTPYIIRKVLGSKTEAKQFRIALSHFGSASGLFKEVSVRAFSRDPSAPFELQIVLSKQPLNLNNVGYGVSQILPVVVEILVKSEHEWFAVQQPEIHLHPRAQAAFGDLLFQIAAHEGKLFLIETHSDFTIDRFRLNYRKKSMKKINSQVLFFERSGRGNTVHAISINRRGNYEKKQPQSFRKFFIREEMRLLGI